MIKSWINYFLENIMPWLIYISMPFTYLTLWGSVFFYTLGDVLPFILIILFLTEGVFVISRIMQAKFVSRIIGLIILVIAPCIVYLWW
jgi:cytochrome c biogenesis protein CcdA